MNNPAQQFDEIARARPTPRATYRLQFNREFTFAQAGSISGYLRELGISDVYASPLFQAGPDSTHGYDICRFEQINPALGGREELDRWCQQLQNDGLGLILDMVPNHMGNDLSNCWWASVLEHGENSPFATFFDIDWTPAPGQPRARVLLPTLEDHYAQVLEEGKLRLALREGALVVQYHDRAFPVAPHCYPQILTEAIATTNQDAPSTLRDDVLALADQIRHRAGTGALLPQDSEQIQEQIRKWTNASQIFREALHQAVERHNGEPGKPRTFDQLHALLSEQHYRLASWRVGPEEINYRRFFDVTQLVSVRMELPLVFQTCHQLIFELLNKGQLTGLRIDHPDGLRDPKLYFRQLQAGYLLSKVTAGKPADAATETAIASWLAERLAPLEQRELHRPVGQDSAGTLQAPRNDPLSGKALHPTWPLYVVAEKILTGNEPLRQDWPVEGTTGYDFLNVLNGLFVNRSHRYDFDELYSSFTGNQTTFRDLVYVSKKQILEHSLASELSALTGRLKTLASRTRYGQDFTLRQLRAALAETISHFPVYRSYVAEDLLAVAPLERFYIEESIAQTKKRQPTLDPAVLNFLQDLLLLRAPSDFDEQAQVLHREFIFRFQQLTGPTTAKGLEDTAFYRFNRLVSLNEVGGDPDRFGVTLNEFHQHNLMKAEQWPQALLATATHDTKRGEDLRARLNVLSEFPGEWAQSVRRWAAMNGSRKQFVQGELAPDRNDEYLLYQILVGAWPFSPSEFNAQSKPDLSAFKDRLVAYMTKALREAKAHTNWTDPNLPYEKATERFVEQLLVSNHAREFLADFMQFQRRVTFFGRLNSLSQLVLKVTSPGVPDFYQGTELWDLSLVDPDNRRPVDYELRKRLLASLTQEINSSPPSELHQRLLRESHSGEIKLYVTIRALALRQRFSELFSRGDYLPIPVAGPKAEYVCAFARRFQKQAVLTVVPRLIAGLTTGAEVLPLGPHIWRDSLLGLPETLAGRYRNVLTGQELALTGATTERELAVSAILDQFPVALLERLPHQASPS